MPCYLSPCRLLTPTKYGRVERVFIHRDSSGPVPVFVKFTTQLSALRVSDLCFASAIVSVRSSSEADIHLVIRPLMHWKAVSSMAIQSQPDFLILTNLKGGFTNNELLVLYINTAK